MAKLTLSDLASLQNETSAIATLNDNNDTLETAFENTLSRDGTSPNSMSASLDMNSNRILNLPAPTNDAEPLRFGDIDSITGISGTIVAPGSSVDNGLVKWTGTTASTIASTNVTVGSNGNDLTVPGTLTQTGVATFTAAPVFSSAIAAATITTLTAPTIKGGTAVGSSLNLYSTSGIGTSDFIRFLTGNSVERMRIDTSGNIVIGATTALSKFHLDGTGTGSNAAKYAINEVGVRAWYMGAGITTSGLFSLKNGSGGVDPITINATSQVGISNQTPAYALDVVGTMGVTGAVTLGGQLNTGVGTTAIAPIQLTAGTNLTTAVAGAMEFDGVNFYKTIDTTSGRGIVPVEQQFRLTATGSTISTIANYFGTTSNISLVSGAHYIIEIFAWFLNTTSGTVVWTFTNSAAPTSQNIFYEMSPATGIVAPPGTATMLVGQIYNDTTAAKALTATAALTDAANHYMHTRIHLINGTGTSLKIQATKSAGSITPGIGSRWIARRVSTTSVGTFAA